MTVEVVATAPGYYTHYRHVGDYFDVDESIFSRKNKKGEVIEKNGKPIELADDKMPSWFARVGSEKAVAAEEAAQAAVDDPDGIDTMEFEELLAFGKSNCPGTNLKRTMKKDTLIKRIKEYRDGLQ